MFDIAQTPEPPYFAVIFTSRLNPAPEGYAAAAEKLEAAVADRPGFLGLEAVRNDLGITVSYWKDLESIRRWKRDVEHRETQKMGREKWYAEYSVRICKVEKDYAFKAPSPVES